MTNKAMQSKRKSITKKLRFEVLKRDSFTCQYCGKAAPDVVLEIDYINPVSNGGDNDIMNLITLCRDCNQGKKHRTLDDHSVIQKQKAMLDELNQRREQLEMLMKWREELQEIDDQCIDAVAARINEFLQLRLMTRAKEVSGAAARFADIRRGGEFLGNSGAGLAGLAAFDRPESEMPGALDL
ncbi:MULTISPECIES: HNH endonuclease [Eikenella]|uniref:HNH endonuclease n=1 Tax=Eikenella TaxID=538 RepID=UPI0007DE56AF|nr:MULTISPECIES: HNH endonuclease [Eikenella]OAM38196.1 hypothetical protein A7P99_03235 [Eikenella sp. NML120348]